MIHPVFPGLVPQTPTLHSLSVSSQHYGTSFLQTSPEGFLKQYMGAYPYQDVFALCKAFRDDLPSTQHSPEFTILEWYRYNMGWQQLCTEVVCLLQRLLLHLSTPLPEVIYSSYWSLLLRQLQQRGIKLQTRTLTTVNWLRIYQQLDLPEVVGIDAQSTHWLQLLWTELVEPTLQSNIQVVYDFPKQQRLFAKLAAATDGIVNEPVAQRFEVYFAGVEIANGWLEETDAQVLKQLMRQQLAHSGAQMPVDKRQLQLPTNAKLSGVAVGIDRLFAKMLNKSMRDVTAFTLCEGSSDQVCKRKTVKKVSQNCVDKSLK